MNRRIRAVLALSVLAASSCVLIPVRTTGTLEPSALAYEDSRFVELLGVDVHYRYTPASTPATGGDRPLIVLLHGFGASTFSWREVAEPLSAYGDVVAYDRPAFGLTERPLSWKGSNPYAPATQTDLLFGLLDELGADKAILVGNSAGGTVAMEAAIAHPERVEALVLVSPAVYGSGGAPGWLRPLFWLPGVNHLGPLLARRLASEGDDFIRSAWYDASGMAPDVIPGYRAPLSIINWEKALWQLTRATPRSRLPERLAGISAPVLVVSGDTDRIVPTEQSVRLASELPSSTLVVIPQSGHVSHEETPAAFMEAFAQFYERFLRGR
ncbi:MAG: alpha/beta hydrolase [Spirochaetales bacterium]|nr:alpha/beta hydrolase [Spirochaetales bacterium]